MEKVPVIPDPHAMMVARNGSWLCDLFQKKGLSCDQKQFIIKQLIKKFKQKMREEANG